VAKRDFYIDNPLIHKDRKLAAHTSEWVRSFSTTALKPLIICRGPIRKEAMDVFDEMGIDQYGILLSEKDSITYTNALAPELRKLTDPNRIHRVPDYSGATKEERQERIRQIANIANSNGYNAIFAGYGFMSEDAEMVIGMEEAGLIFMGPGSYTQSSAGMKDEAKRTALENGVSVTPGVNNGTSIALVNKYGEDGLQKCVDEFKLAVDLSAYNNTEEKCLAILEASYKAGVDVVSIDDIGEALKQEAVRLFQEKPNNRFRLKGIAGGGGKGQRILQAPSSYEGANLEEQIEKAVAKVPDLVRECLIELKTNGVGDNKNVLIEMNIETTRHQEIQVVGNGEWCITMGGRDCSLQMNEQKLLEVSVTQEELAAAKAEAEAAGRTAEAKQLANDITILERMEEEGARFGKAVKLNSVATFECIVDGESHYFMEMNTRIQVEHRVTELCYGLRFTNPNDANDYFETESLVEVMALLALHGKKLPKPTRFKRNNVSVEARLNATNQALQPHAGGIIKKWSDPIEGEIRDDQGISMHNPDTGMFMQYRLAGAYDSNVALLLTVGDSRLDTYQKLAEVIRLTVLRGSDLHTNLEFHYGLVNWFIGNNINARPTTRFIVPYLTAIGQLKEQANQVNLNYAFNRVLKKAIANIDDADIAKGTQTAIERKRSLILRPIEKLFEQPHYLAGWLSLNKKNFTVDNGKVTWLENPIKVLADAYHFLNMEYKNSAPAAYVIWCHDKLILDDALDFYAQLESKLNASSYADLVQKLAADKAEGIDDAQWRAIQAAHAGYQLGTEVFNILPHIALQTAFYDLQVNDDLTITIPDVLSDKALQEAMAKVLVPPPVASSDEIVAVSGGMFYSRESPVHEQFVKEGSHFKAGDPLYIVEVMKMFNKVYAQFSGTIDKVLVETDGSIIKKGQSLFKITPDEVIEIETEEQVEARQRAYTDTLLAKL